MVQLITSPDIFDESAHSCMRNSLYKNGYGELFEYVQDACKSNKHTKSLEPAEVTYLVLYALDMIAQVRQITTLHPNHIIYVKRRINLESSMMMVLFLEFCDEKLIDRLCQTVLCITIHLLAKIGYLDINEMHSVLNDCRGNEIHPLLIVSYDTIDYLESLTNKKEELINFVKNFITVEDNRTYICTLKIDLLKTLIQNQFTSSNYIEIATITNAITPANIHHIDVIKSFLSDLLDQSQIDTHAKEHARKQIKEKVDQIKANNAPQQLFTTQEQTNQTLQHKTEDFIKLLSIPYQNRKEDCKKLLDILTQSGWSKKDHARFALALYKSGNVALQRENIRTFAEWWRICCDIFGWEGADSPYKESQLTPNKATRQISLYL